jgi:hypothetical protein
MAKAQQQKVSAVNLKRRVKALKGEGSLKAKAVALAQAGDALAQEWLDNKAEGKRSKRNLAKRIHRPKSNSTASKTGGKKKKG